MIHVLLFFFFKHTSYTSSLWWPSLSLPNPSPRSTISPWKRTVLHCFKNFIISSFYFLALINRNSNYGVVTILVSGALGIIISFSVQTLRTTD